MIYVYCALAVFFLLVIFVVIFGTVEFIVEDYQDRRAHKNLHLKHLDKINGNSRDH